MSGSGTGSRVGAAIELVVAPIYPRPSAQVYGGLQTGTGRHHMDLRDWKLILRVVVAMIEYVLDGR